MATEMPFIVATSYSNATDVSTLLDGLRPGFNTSDSLDTNMSTALLDVTNTVNISTPVTLSPIEDSFALGISESGIKMFSYIARTFLGPIVSIVGFAGNSLGVGVLWRQAKQQKLSIFWYLCALTMVDCIYLGLGVIDGIAFVVQAFDQELSKYLVAHFRLGLAYCDINCIHNARYIVLVMSCERLISVINPFHVKDTWFAKYPGRITFTCIFFNAIFYLPVVINSTVITVKDMNSTEYIFTFKNVETFMAQFWIVDAIIHSFIPMILLVAINIAIPVQFYRATIKLRSARSATSVSQQGKITATVLVITIMYIFLAIPIMVNTILQYNPDFNTSGKYRLIFWFTANLGKCLAYFNAANDFLVFYLVSNNYRAVSRAMYCGPCRRDAIAQKPAQKTHDTDDRSTGIDTGVRSTGVKDSTSFGSKATLSSNLSS